VAPPYSLPLWVVSFLFLAYLAGTVASPWAGSLAGRHGRLPVLLAALAVMAIGIIVTAVPHVIAVLVGLLVLTAGFFGAHAIASGWAPAAAASQTRAQAASLYYLGYYGGSSLFGWLLGYAFHDLGWPGVAGCTLAMVAVAGLLAVLGLRAPRRAA
jgi:MFS transporter, YNFM family, putative membrane transport protein